MIGIIIIILVVIAFAAKYAVNKKQQLTLRAERRANWEKLLSTLRKEWEGEFARTYVRPTVTEAGRQMMASNAMSCMPGNEHYAKSSFMDRKERNFRNQNPEP